MLDDRLTVRISKDAKKLLQESAKEEGLTIGKWLDNAIREKIMLDEFVEYQDTN